MSLPAEETASYTTKIDAILAKSDLNTVSAKQIRKDLQQGTSEDLSAKKAELNALIKQRFENFAATNGIADQPKSPPPPAPQVNGYAHSSDNKAAPHSPAGSPAVKHSVESEEPSDVADDRPPKKKPKKSTPLDDDAAFAARLQAEENSRARSTRGGATKKRPTVQKKQKSPVKKKSSAKVKAEDDSDMGSGDGEEKPKKRNGAFHKPLYLSPALAELLGQDVLSRPQTVKGIWDYVKEKQLQNPSDKRQIICDDALRSVFKKDSVNMFSMNKLLSTQLTPVDEAV